MRIIYKKNTKEEYSHEKLRDLKKSLEEIQDLINSNRSGPDQFEQSIPWYVRVFDLFKKEKMPQKECVRLL